jgi:hypothetical protein
MAPERFVSSMAGGVMLDSSGAPSGRVPEGSFVDLKDGKIYGPDSKPLSIPTGSTVDFFDLPSVEDLQKEHAAMGEMYEQMKAGGGTTVGDKGSAPGKGAVTTAVDGQWGPGGTTSFGGGQDSSTATSKVGGASGTGTDAAPIKGGGAAASAAGLASIMQALQTAMAQIAGLTGGTAPAVAGTSGGGATDAVAGTSKIGTVPSLQSSLDELVKTLKVLVDVIRTSKITGGGAPAKTETAPAKTESAPAKTETAPAKTETATDSTTASTSTATSTAKTDDATSTSTSTDDTSTSTSTDSSAT